MTATSRKLFPKSENKKMHVLVNGRSLFTAKGYLFEYIPDKNCWSEGSNPQAIQITPILESTGKVSHYWFCLPNDPELLRDIAEYLQDLSCQIEADTDDLREEYRASQDRLVNRKP